MNTETAVQYIAECNSREDAETTAQVLATQDGLMGLRINAPAFSDPKWYVQAFFDAEGVGPMDTLPDGCRLVVLLASMTFARRICSEIAA